MKQKTPTVPTSTTLLFPSFFRFITEYSFSEAHSKNIKIVLTSAISLFLLALISLQGIIYWRHTQQQQFLVSQRTDVQKEVQYWQLVADKYKGYRDVYYRIASLQYKLGNVQAAQMYVKKALELDPNFAAGHVLGVKIGLEK